ncbi:hypothetical protein Q7A53_16590 [Halobacillus rhizosphaerae]|uniref:hypothetical protein n=1 Tax=Halobacillus rhizosphaerae TaxID=3064889 RepID=UPI00398A6459
MKSNRKEESAAFQGSGREFIYVAYLLLVSFLMPLLPFPVKYALIPLLLFMIVMTLRSRKRYAKWKVSLLLVLIILFLLP